MKILIVGSGGREHGLAWKIAQSPHGVRRSQIAATELCAVVPDRFDRAAFHRLFAKSFFFRRLRLFIDIRVAAVVVPLEIGRRGFAAQIAIDALIIDIEFACYVFGVFVRDIGHGFASKVKGNARKKR